MKVGSLVIWKHDPYIGVVIGADYRYVTVHWFEEGNVSRENSCDLREVTDESR